MYSSLNSYSVQLKTCSKCGKPMLTTEVGKNAQCVNLLCESHPAHNGHFKKTNKLEKRFNLDRKPSYRSTIQRKQRNVLSRSTSDYRGNSHHRWSNIDELYESNNRSSDNFSVISELSQETAAFRTQYKSHDELFLGHSIEEKEDYDELLNIGKGKETKKKRIQYHEDDKNEDDDFIKSAQTLLDRFSSKDYFEDSKPSRKNEKKWQRNNDASQHISPKNSSRSRRTKYYDNNDDLLNKLDEIEKKFSSKFPFSSATQARNKSRTKLSSGRRLAETDYDPDYHPRSHRFDSRETKTSSTPGRYSRKSGYTEEDESMLRMEKALEKIRDAKALFDENKNYVIIEREKRLAQKKDLRHSVGDLASYDPTSAELVEELRDASRTIRELLSKVNLTENY